MTLRVGLTHPALAQELKLTWMDYLLTMLRNRLRRKHSYDTASRRTPSHQGTHTHTKAGRPQMRSPFGVDLQGVQSRDEVFTRQPGVPVSIFSPNPSPSGVLRILLYM